jgi:hypothetical protein
VCRVGDVVAYLRAFFDIAAGAGVVNITALNNIKIEF